MPELNRGIESILTRYLGIQRFGSPASVSSRLSLDISTSKVDRSTSDSPFAASRREPTAISGISESCIPSALTIDSSTLMCGTISPPIFEKREILPFMNMKPSSSSAARSPVFSQPSRSFFLFSSGWLRYPPNMLAPLRHNSPVEPMGRNSPVSGSATAAIIPGKSSPTDSGFVRLGWGQRLPRLRFGGRFTATTGDASVSP